MEGYGDHRYEPLSAEKMEDVVDAYLAPDYEPIGPIKSFHGVPRFGHSSNITDIFTDDGSLDSDKLIDYIMGSIFIAAFLLTTYIMFVFTVIIFKLCFGAKAGILAGHPFVEDKSIVFDKPRKNSYFRTFIIVMCLVVVTGGLVFLTKGTQKVRAVANDVRDGTDGFIAVSQKVIDTTTLMITFGEDTLPLRNDLIDVIDGGLCQSFQGGNENPEDTFDEAASSLVVILTELQNFANSELTDIRDTFENDVMSLSQKTANATNNTEILANPALYAVPAITLGLLLLIGTVFAWLEIGGSGFFWVQTWIIMPLFFILLFSSIILIAVVGAVLVANSDFCIGNEKGNPEGTMENILNKFNIEDEAMSALDNYIINGCVGEYHQLVAVQDLLVQLDEATVSARDLYFLLIQNKKEFTALCGGEEDSLDPLQNIIAAALEKFDDVAEIGESTTDLLSCEDINSIWIDIVHDAMCTSAPSAFTWMFSAITSVYGAGTMIYLLRGALLPSLDSDAKGRHGVYDDNDEMSAYTEDDMMY